MNPKTRRGATFYVMGFDPRGSAFYHALLKREARLAQRRGFARVSVGALQEDQPQLQRCDLQLEHGVQPYFFLNILDLILPFFRQHCWQRWRDALMIFFGLTVLGLLWRSRQASAKFSLFMFYPLLLLILSLITSLALSFTLAPVITAYSWPDSPLWLNTVWQVGLTLGFMYGSYGLIALTERWHYSLYLLGDFIFSAQVIAASNPALEARLQVFADTIAEAVQNAAPDEEILLVGHSSGGLLAIRLAALVQARLAVSQHHKLALLTMGNQCSIALLDRALPLQQAVQQLAQAKGLIWREVFAPQDVISSGKFDLYHHLTGQQSANFALWSARFKESLSPTTYQATRLRFFNMHMQYLRASETGAGFDYLQLLSQNLPLAGYRYRNHHEV